MQNYLDVFQIICILQIHSVFNPLPDNKILDRSKLNQSADDNFEFDEIAESCLNG